MFCFAYSSFHFGFLGGFLRSILFVLFVWVLGPGGESGEWDTCFFSLSNNSVLFAVLFFLQKRFCS